jgi:hypothetical protein
VSNYLTVPLSFQLADKRLFSDLNELLKWFCKAINRRLKITDKEVTENWDSEAVLESCTTYFEENLLDTFEKRGQSLILGLDEVDLVFEHMNIASDFFSMLRSWNEMSKFNPLWERFRLIIVHSTEAYIPLKINESPFNVGFGVDLPEFTKEQVADLASRHGLDWKSNDIDSLSEMVGGHPFLIRNTLYYIARQEITLDKLLRTAPTDEGLFGDHLRRHLWNLEQYQLTEPMKIVVSSRNPVEVKSIDAFKLESMGLINRQVNGVTPRCELYRLYFDTHLK